jgi:membrane protein YqaA with SNARE-associated domain
MGELTASFALFTTALIGGTFLPFIPASGELALSALVIAGASPLQLIAVATLGSLLGASVNYFIGRYIAGLAGRRWFPISAERLERARGWFARYGLWVMMMCWIPALGDAVTTAAGVLCCGPISDFSCSSSLSAGCSAIRAPQPG